MKITLKKIHNWIFSYENESKKLIHLLSVILFKLSRGFVGKVDGWMKLYQKD